MCSITQLDFARLLITIEIKYDTFDDVLNIANALVDYAKETGFGDNKVNLVLNGPKFNFIKKRD